MKIFLWQIYYGLKLFKLSHVASIREEFVYKWTKLHKCAHVLLNDNGPFSSAYQKNWQFFGWSWKIDDQWVWLLCPARRVHWMVLLFLEDCDCFYFLWPMDLPALKESAISTSDYSSDWRIPLFTCSLSRCLIAHGTQSYTKLAREKNLGSIDSLCSV